MQHSAAAVLWYEGPAALLRSGRGDPWERGVALGAVGSYAEARAMLVPLGSSRALSTLASHARQVGRHDAAEALDVAALAAVDAAGTASAADALADATSGLVADALGRHDADLALGRLPAARAAVRDWRSAVRCDWVAAELSLLRGDGRAAVAAAERSVATARHAGAPRHLAKSLLVRGVARHVAAREGADDLLAALAQAQQLGCATLVWPAAQVAAEALPARAAELRATAGEAARAVVAGLGSDGAAFAARADITELLTPVKRPAPER